MSKPSLHESVYRFFNREGELLYVGISSDPLKRFAHHRCSLPLWTEVHRIEIELCTSRRQAVEIEKAAIKAESPLWNKDHNIKEPRSNYTLAEREFMQAAYDEAGSLRKAIEKLNAAGFTSPNGKALQPTSLALQIKQKKAA